MESYQLNTLQQSKTECWADLNPETMGTFSDGDVWSGGFYELMLEYKPGAVNGLMRALEFIWGSDWLDGCYLDSQRDPEQQPKLVFEPSLVAANHLYGVATLPGPIRVACGTCCLQDPSSFDWVDFYFPMSALGQHYPVGGFPFDSGHHESWRIPLDNWLADLGRRIFQEAPFELGLVGFETEADMDAAELIKTGIPSKRYDGLLVPGPDGLVWHPRTAW